MTLSIVLADDHEPSLLILQGILTAMPHCHVLAHAANGREAVAAVAQHRPHLLLLDIAMPIMNGIEAARLVKAQFPDTQILFVTGQINRAYVRAAFTAGASGYVDKAKAQEDLPAAIHHILAGETFLSSGLHQ